MKKTYIKPYIEFTRLSTRDIVAASLTLQTNNIENEDEALYSDLFTIN